MKNEIMETKTSISPIPEFQTLQNNFSMAFQLVDDIILKNYIANLHEMPVIPPDETLLANNLEKIRLFKITEMVYEKKEPALYKFASVFNAVAAMNSAIIAVIDSNGEKTDFYLGIRSLSEKNSTQTCYSALANAIKGQFPGIQTENLKIAQIKQLLDSVPYDSISAVSCVANNKNKNFLDNNEYLQGLEKLVIAMQGSKYTAVIFANPVPQNQLNIVRQSYENVYTKLSPYANSVVSYGVNSSFSNTTTQTSGENYSNSVGNTKTTTSSTTITKNTGEVITETEQTCRRKVGSAIAATLPIAGAMIGNFLPRIGSGIGMAAGSAIGSAISAATSKTVSRTHGGGSESVSSAVSDSLSTTDTYGTSYSLANSLGLTSGENQNLQLTVQNKTVISMLDRMDKHLKRLSEFESIGMWECAAYFMSADPSVSEVAASTYKALMSGEDSGIEISAVNTWHDPQKNNTEEISQNEQIAKYILNFIHPVFSYSVNGSTIPATPANFVSSNELAIHMGLPRNSVCGFPVIEHSDFGKEVVKYQKQDSSGMVKLGKVFNMGCEIEGSNVALDIDSLAMHTFIVGATGSGKSNTVYSLLKNLIDARSNDLTFMVIEPAKGEYKQVFGHKRNVSVFGTNPEYTELLKINPFKFPKEIHVLEHIDRLIEIFNVCWPMYAAMPAVLKDAVLASYKACGWDLTYSKNSVSDNLFPTFQDLLEQLIYVINDSAYSDEVKSNYIGSLTTRVKSLTNGLNGQIFSSNEIDNDVLFDSNVIIDLSRIGAQETKALIMGILVMRLLEHRMSNSKNPNSRLRHITVLEEAHNILGKPYQSNPEGANISGKSVEMLSNAIAEMRTYGEGFIIADQSPGAVDASAIRNTNTKIILRLPDENDRRISGKAAALKDDQVDEIAKLPKGVAVVYQNDWINPVLCKIDKFNGKEKPFRKSCMDDFSGAQKANSVLINFILKNRLDNPDKLNCKQIVEAIECCDCTAKTKTILYSLSKEYRTKNSLEIWSPKNFSKQSRLVVDVLKLNDAVEDISKSSSDFISFTCGLNTVISQKLDNISDELLLQISHCLIKTYSESVKDGAEFYKAWVEKTVERGKIL